MGVGRGVLLDALEQLDISVLFGDVPFGTLQVGEFEGREPPRITLARGGAQRTRSVAANHPDIAVGMAMGFARASGTVGVVHLGTPWTLRRAAGNLANASRARCPLVLLAPLDEDTLVMLRAMTHAVITASAAEQLPRALQRAVGEALVPPAGPVALAVPDAVLLAETVARQQCITISRAGTRADEVELARGGALLAGAENPLIVAGDGVGLSDAWPELVALAERVGAPVYTEPAPSVWGFPNRHAHWQGALARERVFEGIDVALVCGVALEASIPPAVKVVLVTDDPHDIARANHITTALLGEIKLNLSGLLAALRATSQTRSALAAATRRRALLDHAAQERSNAREARLAALEAGESMQLTPELVAAELAQALPADAVYCEDARSSGVPLLELAEFSQPSSYWSGGPGATLSGALGIHLAGPHRPVVVAIDEAELLMYPQVLATAAETVSGRLVCLVLSGGGIDWTAVGRGMGVAAERVAGREELTQALQRALAADRTQVVEVRLD